MSARLRKHKRQTPNLRRNARGRPQMWQRLFFRVENFGFLFAFAILPVVAIVSFTPGLGPGSNWYYCAARNGMPMCFSSARAWSSLPAVVTIVMFIPFIFSTLE